ncbi:MAG: CinA family protein [Azospirillaceae bacterium]
MFDSTLLQAAETLLDLCRKERKTLACAESCTGGLITAILTAVPGSSDVVDRGFVTYSNGAKSEMLGVDPHMIERHGAVSAEVARAMAQGAIRHSAADVAVSVTGIAGPGGATPGKPVGLVFIGWMQRGGVPMAARHVFEGDRQAIREAAAREVITTTFVDAVRR